jgi:hypothetical protein
MSDAVREWQQLYLDAAQAAPSQAACVAAAFRLADQVWRDLAADPALDTATRAAVSDGAAWARTALAAYHHLHDTRAYTHLDLPTPPRCQADISLLRGWLNAPSDLPGFAHTTTAQSWQIDDDFTWDADGIGARMSALLTQAQHTGVFGVPDYQISLRQTTTDDPDADAFIEHQITLHTPSGATLAAHPVPTDHLIDPDLHGVDAAATLFTNVAAIVGELLAQQQHLSAADTGPRAGAARPRRGFPPLTPHPPTPIPTTTHVWPPTVGQGPHR